MKKVIATSLGCLLLAAPALALADSFTSAQTQILHLTAIVAALEAQESALSGQPVACAALASKPSVRVNEQFALAWGSVGTTDSASSSGNSTWTPNGSSIVSIQQLGTWTYSFTFYGAQGATATCTAKIVVVS
jgi:hypothetical protein